MTEGRGGAREGAGRKIGWRKENPKVMKSMRLDSSLVTELESIFPERTFVSKIEEAIKLFLKENQKNKK